MTPESIPGLRITQADIAPIWQAIADLRSVQLAAVVNQLQAPTQSRLPEHLAA